MKSIRVRHLAIFLALSFSGYSRAQSLLPEGIIGWQLGYRAYSSQENAFDSNFQLRPIGADYTTKFDNEMLISGKAGKDLQKLANVLETIGDPSETRLDLGTMQQNVAANFSAAIYGLAYGASDDLTVYFGVPWTTARVTNSIQFSGTNNALAILDRLGTMAFDELRQGLEQASRVDGNTIQQTIEAEGYGPIDLWEYAGFGDAIVGARTAASFEILDGMNIQMEYNPYLGIPTGHVDDPDLINDIGLGTGYFQFGQSISQRVDLIYGLRVVLDQTYVYNFDAKFKKRLPEDSEAVVAADRKTSILMNPGDDLELGAGFEFDAGAFSLTSRVSEKKHFKDKYSGSLVGNYKKLSENSDTELTSISIGFTMNTVEWFKKEEFFMPFIARLGASYPLAGRNSPNFQYYELTFLSFLDAR